MTHSDHRIETKTSTTADIMCLARAASYKDKRECYSGPDYIAYELVPGFFKLVVKSRRLFKILSRRFFSKGIYEYVIARTKYFDAAFTTALEQGFDQILIFGAGFDSRALRFGDLNKGTMVYELDAPITQQEKLKAYQSKKLPMHKSLIFVPIDFNKERLEDKMSQAGFVAGKETLYMLEGVTMYLSKDAVEATLRFVSNSSGKNSMVVFDHIYAGVLRGENKYYGEKGLYKRTAKVGEEWTFALEENEAEPFLNKFGFTVKDYCNAHELEERCFRNSKGAIVAKINGTHAIVTAIKS